VNREESAISVRISLDELKTYTEYDPEGAEEFVALIRALREEGSRPLASQAVFAGKALAVSLFTLAEIEYGMTDASSQE
jgi:hypothetical protein